MKNIGLAIFIIALFVILVAVIIFVGIYSDSPPTAQRLMSPTELQEYIGVEPDGKIGPETMAAWDKALCDQYAAESQEKYVDENGKLTIGLENPN